MMREILFRGKRVDNGEWVIGYYVQKQDSLLTGITYHYILTQERDSCGCLMSTVSWYKVIPETVGQYTGLTDKNGKKIFEGDIVKAVHNSGYIGMPVTDFGIGVVEYSGTYYGGASYQINIIGDAGARVFSPGLEGGVTVLGNVWDNHEVLEDKK